MLALFYMDKGRKVKDKLKAGINAINLSMLLD